MDEDKDSKIILVPVVARAYVRLKVNSNKLPVDVDNWTDQDWDFVNEKTEDHFFDLKPSWEIDDANDPTWIVNDPALK